MSSKSQRGSMAFPEILFLLVLALTGLSVMFFYNHPRAEVPHKTATGRVVAVIHNPEAWEHPKTIFVFDGGETLKFDEVILPMPLVLPGDSVMIYYHQRMKESYPTFDSATTNVIPTP